MPAWPLLAWLRRQDPVVWGAVLLVACYAWAYLAYPELPGRRANFPLGWWGWFDQSRTLRSATALARLDFAPDEHWYPLGYAILGAPFTRPLAAHAYFFVDLAALLLAFAAFGRFAVNAGIGPRCAVAVFLFATLADRQIFAQWAIPWNTSPTAALTWLLLALVTRPARADPAESAWRSIAAPSIAIGLVAGCIPLFRPTDAVVVAACLATSLAADLLGARTRERRFPLRRWLLIAAAGAVPLLVYAGLHLAIYGAHETGYMRQSRALGFTLYDLGWKAYVIFLDPRGWFHDGEGLLRRYPWIALGIAGLVPALRRGRPMVVLVAMLLAHATLYVSYIDLLPPGLWRHLTVHYFVWAMPGYALLAFVLIEDIVRPGPAIGGPARAVAIGCAAATALLLCVRLDPVAAGAGEAAKMLLFPDIAANFDDAYYAPVALRDDAGEQENVYAIRAVPAADGLRVVALRRPFIGDVAWVQGRVPDWGGAPAAAPPRRFRIGFRFGFPCWLPGAACRE